MDAAQVLRVVVRAAGHAGWSVAAPCLPRALCGDAARRAVGWWREMVGGAVAEGNLHQPILPHRGSPPLTCAGAGGAWGRVLDSRRPAATSRCSGPAAPVQPVAKLRNGGIAAAVSTHRR